MSNCILSADHHGCHMYADRWLLCANAGVAIPGDTAAIETVGVETTAEAIFVIEKEAIFQVLCRRQMQRYVSWVRLITASRSVDERL